MSETPGRPAFSEEDLLPLSALADLVFCERRAALHHLERIWEDNLFTVEGSHLHERVDLHETEVRGDLRIARGLFLHSLRLGLSGKADVVEFHRLMSDEEVPGRKGVSLPGVLGFWRPVPVEYKRGQLRREDGYEVQLCAQALCLEEMLEVEIPAGALFYGKSRRRLEITFDAALRSETEKAAARLHELVRSRVTPRAAYTPKCDRCSLLSLCMPKTTGSRRTVRTYLRGVLAEAEGLTTEEGEV